MTAPIIGERSGRTYTPKTLLRDTKLTRYERGILGSATLYDGKSDHGSAYPYMLEVGTLLSRVTATSKLSPLKLTALNGAASADTDLVVDESRFFQVGDTITVGTTDSTITAIDYTTDTLTVDTATTESDGAVVKARGDLAGAEIPIGILDEFVDGENPSSRAVEDRQVGKMLIWGFVIDSSVVGDLTQGQAISGNKLGNIFFQSDHGLV